MRPYPLFSISSFFARIWFACLLVFGTYNPSGRSYLHWLAHDSDVGFLVKLLTGVALLFVYRVIIVVTLRALGIVGSLTLLMIFVLLWLVLWHWIATEPWMAINALLAMVACFLGVGLSYSGILYRLSRQVQSSSINQNQTVL